MTVEDRRNSVLRSSISIKSIQKSVVNFKEGLTKLGSTSNDIVSQTKETNLFKSKLVREDDKFFERRRENVRRKQREDELESASNTGVARKQGNIITRSTKGFLGRVIDFFAVTLLGFFITVLPNLLKKFSFFIVLITKTVEVLKFFTDGIANFIVDIEEGITAQITRIRRVDFSELNQKLKEKSDQVVNGLLKLNRNIFQGGKLFVDVTKQIQDDDLAVFDESLEIEPEKIQNDNLRQDGSGDRFDELNEKEKEELKELLKKQSQEKESSSDDSTPSQKQNDKNADDINSDDVDQIKSQDELPSENDIKPPARRRGDGPGGGMMTDSFVEGFLKRDVTDKNEEEKKIISKEDIDAKKQELEQKINDGDNEFDLEPEEGFANIDGMFDPVGTSNKRKKTEFGPGLFDNEIVVSKVPPKVDTITQERKSDTVIIVNNNQNTPQGGGVNTSGGGSSTTIPINIGENKNTMKKIQSKVLSGF